MSLRRYADYEVAVKDDLNASVELASIDGQIARFHFRAFRIPSRKLFTIRHCHNASRDEREWAEGWAKGLTAGRWDTISPRAIKKVRHADGYYYFQTKL